VPAEPSGLEIQPWVKLASLGYFLLFVLLYGSVAVGFLFESRAAVFVALGAFAGTLVVHLVVSIVTYRRVKRREWPRVEPIAGDDERDAA
jgi:hypothetical protein